MAATGSSDVKQREGFINHEQANNADAVTAVGSSFGFGPCRPRWLQIFAKPICFMIILNIYCFVEGTIVSGKGSVI